MKSYTDYLWFNTRHRQEFINITPMIEEAVRTSAVAEGICLVNAMHITSSVFINDDESGLHGDFDEWLDSVDQIQMAVIDATPTSGLSRKRSGSSGRRSTKAKTSTGSSSSETETPVS